MLSCYKIQKNEDNTYRATLNPVKLETKLDDLEGTGLHSINMLSEHFCDDLLDEALWLQNPKNEGAKYVLGTTLNSMNPFNSVGLNKIGLGHIIDTFIHLFIKPIAQLCFPQIYTELDTQHSFVVQYEVGKAVDLALHSDNSDVTVNMCLADGFEGGEVFFGSVRGQNKTAHEDNQVKYTYKHQKGRGVLHLGEHLHGATPITSGKRYGLIVWAYSAALRRSYCPCCRHYNRIQVKESESAQCVCHKNKL
jgi:hypothetical protein